MVYPARIAVIDPATPTRTIELQIGAELPALNFTTPTFPNAGFLEFFGSSAELPFIRKQNDGNVPLQVVRFIGLDEGEFGEFINGDSGTSFNNGQGMFVADGMAFNIITAVQGSNTQYTLTTSRFDFSAFTGGTQAGSFVAPSADTLTFVKDVITPGGLTAAFPDPLSSDAAPSCLLLGGLSPTDWPDAGISGPEFYYAAYRLAADGSIEIAGTVAYGEDGVGRDMIIRAGSQFYGLGACFEAAGAIDYYGFTEFQFGIWDEDFGTATWDFTNYKAEIDDAHIQGLLDTADVRFRPSPQGWLLEFYDAAADKKLILISPDWATYSYIEFTGVDVQAQAVIDAWLAGANDGNTKRIGHAAIDADGTWYLLYGAIATPAYAYGAEAAVCDLTVGDIFLDIAKRCGLDASEVDVSAASPCSRGMIWTQAQAKQIVAPVLDIHDLDARMHDFGIQLIRRGGAAGAAIDSEFMVRESAEDPLYEITPSHELDLPRRIFFAFADANADWQPNSVPSQRSLDAVETRKEITIDLGNMAFTPDEARPLVDRFFRGLWFKRERAKFELSALAWLIEAGDVHPIIFDDDTLRMKCVRVTNRANDVIATEWERDEAELAVLNAAPGAAMSGRPPSTIFAPGPTETFAIDSPLISDAHDQTAPFIYVAAAPQNDADAWPGADILHSESGDPDTYEAGWDGFSAGEAATWGTIADPLPDALPWVIDRGTQAIVVMGSGELDSITEAQLLASQEIHLGMIGREMIQFQIAELIAPRTYRLSILIRGVRGTEHEIAEHEAGERFILLDGMVKRHALGASEIGDTDWYLGITFGRDESSGTAQALEFSAAAHKPLSPVHVSAVLDAGTGSWHFACTRRTRIGGASLDGQDVPLGESSEAYRFRISKGSGIAERIIESTEPEAEWTAAQQIEDFGAPQAMVSGTVCQRSPALGIDGFETAFAA